MDDPPSPEQISPARPEMVVQPAPPVAPLSSGALRLDLACGGGVYPGEIVEICGPPDSGKSLLCLRLAAAAQHAGGECAWIDADWSFDLAFARRLGVRLDGRPDTSQGGRADAAASIDSLILARPVCAEAAMDMLRRLAAAGPRLIVVDSLGSLISRQEIDGIAGEQEMVEIKQLSLALRSVTPELARRGISLVIVRQSAAGADGAASAPTSAAYHGLRHNLERLSVDLHAGLTVQLERGRTIWGAGQPVGLRAQARVIRPRRLRANNNSIKIAPCSQRVDFDIMYKQGFIRTGEVFDLGIETGSVHIQEGRYYFQDRELGSGRVAAIQAMEQKALTLEVVQVIRQQMLRKYAQEHR